MKRNAIWNTWTKLQLRSPSNQPPNLNPQHFISIWMGLSRKSWKKINNNFGKPNKLFDKSPIDKDKTPEIEY